MVIITPHQSNRETQPIFLNLPYSSEVHLSPQMRKILLKKERKEKTH
jgi:hypothetical protein